MSVVDNISGDTTFVPSRLLRSKRRVDGNGHPGCGGDRRRQRHVVATDLFGVLPPIALGEKHWQRLSEPRPGVRQTRIFPLMAFWIYSGGRYAFGPTLAQAAQRPRRARVNSSNPQMAAYSRTYTTRPDGGTFGDMLPFIPPVAGRCSISAASKPARGSPHQHRPLQQPRGRRQIVYCSTTRTARSSRTSTTIDLTFPPRCGAALVVDERADLPGGVSASPSSRSAPADRGRPRLTRRQLTGDPTNLW